jgi:hypothetical protein
MANLYPAFPIAVAVAIFAILAKHALDMRGKQNYREMWGCLTLSLLPAALFCLWATSGESSMAMRNIILIPVGALVGACVFAYGGYLFSDIMVARAQSQASTTFKEAQLTPSERGPIINQNVTSHNQSGGITAHTVNVGPAPRNINAPESASLKAQMLRDLPRDKEITVMALMGDVEAAEFALQIHAFLKENGFKLKEDGISQGVFTRPPRGLSFNSDDNTFVVGAR